MLRSGVVTARGRLSPRRRVREFLCVREPLQPEAAPFGTQRAVFQARNQSGMNVSFFLGCDGPECESASRGAPRHEIPRIDSDFSAVAYDDHPSIDCQQFQIRGEVHVREHF